jgi:C-terminal processing protease CtpA/Prc
VEATAPGEKGYVRKGDFILEINGDDAVDMEFDYVINVIKEHIHCDDLVLTVGDEKVLKKWIKNRKSSSLKKSKSNQTGKSKKSS